MVIILPAKQVVFMQCSCSVHAVFRQSLQMHGWCSTSIKKEFGVKILFYASLAYSNYLRSLKWPEVIIMQAYCLQKWCHQFGVKKVMPEWHKNEFGLFQFVSGMLGSTSDVSSSNTRSMVSTISHQCITISHKCGVMTPLQFDSVDCEWLTKINVFIYWSYCKRRCW